MESNLTVNPHPAPLSPFLGALLPAAATGGSFVTTDQEAVSAFLSTLEHGPSQTLRAYRKELGRFLTWLAHQGYEFSAESVLQRLTVRDFQGYVGFLRSDVPLAKLGVEGTGLSNRGFWKLAQALSPASVDHALSLLRIFFEYLTEIETDQGVPFRETNPVKALGRSKNADLPLRQPGERRKAATSNGEEIITNVLSESDMSVIFAAIYALPRTTKRELAHFHRNLWVIQLGYRSFLRISEMARLQMGDFEHTALGWRLYVHARKAHGAASFIQAPSKLIADLVAYRRSLGKIPYPSRLEPDPAIMTISKSDRRLHESALPYSFTLPGGGRRIEEPARIYRPLSERGLFAIIKNVFRLAARSAPDEATRERLMSASPHWLRHTGITAARTAGVSLRTLQAQAGHASESTTALYDHGDEKARAEEMEQF